MSDKPASANRRGAAGDLPPCEAPGDDSSAVERANGGGGGRATLVTLLLVPLLVAVSLATVTVLFSWLALAGEEPHELVRGLQRADRNGWRQAVTLVQLLRDPQHAELRQDRLLAQQTAGVLSAELDAASFADDRLRLRSFLCRAAGQFDCPEVLPALIRAAETERDPREMDVRRSALEAIAERAARRPRGQRGGDVRLFHAAIAATETAAADGGSCAARDTLRATAVFALGVLESDAAVPRLIELLEDRCPEVRYNAATALARCGCDQAVGVLLEMLDPAAIQALGNETSDRGRRWKQQLVLRNALRSAQSLAAANGRVDQRLVLAVSRLAEGAADMAILNQSRQTLQALQAPPTAAKRGCDG